MAANSSALTVFWNGKVIARPGMRSSSLAHAITLPENVTAPIKMESWMLSITKAGAGAPV